MPSAQAGGNTRGGVCHPYSHAAFNSVLENLRKTRIYAKGREDIRMGPKLLV